MAPRPIDGLCAKALAFKQNMLLEELIVQHAFGEDVSHARTRTAAAAVMMIPVPRAGVYQTVRSVESAEAFVDGVMITAKEDRECCRYRKETPISDFCLLAGKRPWALRSAYSGRAMLWNLTLQKCCRSSAGRRSNGSIDAFP